MMKSRFRLRRHLLLLLLVHFVPPPPVGPALGQIAPRAGEGAPPVGPPVARAVAVETPPVVDGRLDDPVWARAIPLGPFTQREPEAGAPATEPTEVRILYTGSTLYFSIRCLQADPARLRARQLRYDGDFEGDDRIEIILDTFADGRSAYAFRFNPLGAQWDAQVSDQGERVNVAWDGVWQVRTRLEPWGWSAEVAIPFATLRFPAAKGQRWGMNIQRVIRHRNEEAFWAPVERGLGSGTGGPAAVDGKYRTAFAGRLEGLAGVRPGRRWEIKPYALGGRTSAAGAGGAIDWPARAGFDLRWTAAEQMVGDLAVRPDFAQVEADQEQISLDRFPLFFPEKREFFQEGLSVFDFGVPGFGSPPAFQLFYSRRIGLAESPAGDRFEVPIDAGLKVTGRSGPWTAGLLAVRSGQARFEGGQEPFLLPAAGQAAFRLSRDVLERSRIGLLGVAADRGLDGRPYGAGGLDARLSLWRNTQIDGFVALSRRGEDRPAAAGALNYSWTTDRWGVEVGNLFVARDWADDLGFVPRTGVWRNKAALTWSPRPKWPGVRQAVVFADGLWHTRPSGLRESHLITPGGMLLFENGSTLIGGLAFWFERLESPFALGDFIAPAGGHDFTSAFLRLDTDSSRRGGAGLQVSGGTFYHGTRRTVLTHLWWRPSPAWSAEWIGNANRIRDDEARFRGETGGVRLTWTPTVRTVAKLFAQRNTASGTGSFNLLAAWRYRPRSHLYLVLDQTFERGPPGWQRADRALLLKISWLGLL